MPRGNLPPLPRVVELTDPEPRGGYWRDVSGDVIGPAPGGWKFVVEAGEIVWDERSSWTWHSLRENNDDYPAFPLVRLDPCRECRRIPGLRHKMDCSQGR